jgi:hypothetical protein
MQSIADHCILFELDTYHFSHQSSPLATTLTYLPHEMIFNIQPLGPLLTDVLGAPLFRLATLATRSVSQQPRPFGQPAERLGKARTVSDET